MTAEPKIGPIHHIAIVVRSIDAALPRYRELLGLLPEAVPVTFESQRVRLCFLPTGPDPAARIELVEPIDEESGVARFLAARGEGVHHVCLVTDDLPAEIERLAASRSRADRPGAACRSPWRGRLHPPTHPQRRAVGAAPGRSAGAVEPVTTVAQPFAAERVDLEGDLEILVGRLALREGGGAVGESDDL